MLCIVLLIIALIHQNTSQSITVERKLLTALKKMTEESMTKSDVETLSPTCIDILSNTMLKDNAFLIKFFHDTAHNMNDLGSYQDCISKVYYFNDYPDYSPIVKRNTEHVLSQMTYVLFSGVNLQNYQFTLYGACLPKGCTDKDYVFFTKNFYIILGLTDIPNINEIESTQLTIDNDVPFMFFYGLPAVLLLIVLILFSCFPKFPVFLFKCCCFKKKPHILNDSKTSTSLIDEDYSRVTLTTTTTNALGSVSLSSKYDTRKISMFKECWKLKENLRALNVSDTNLHESSINNDGGFSAIRGIRGVILIMYLISHSFKSLSNNNYKDYNEDYYFHSPLNSTLFFFIRFSMSALIALSSFTLAYKLVSYLEKETNLIEKVEESTNKNNNNSNNNSDKNEDKKSIGTPILPGESIDDKGKDKDDNDNDILNDKDLNDLFQSNDIYRSQLPVMSLIKFIMRQFYKYFLFIITIIIAKFSYYEIIACFFGHGAMWKYMKTFLIDFIDIYHILEHFFLIFPWIPNNKFGANPFGLVILEISYFIIGSILIFICYKKNWRLDIIIVSFFITVLFGKLTYAIVSYVLNLSKTSLKGFFPAKDFTQRHWNFLRNNQLYNGDSFAIGIFFGLVNYAIQNNISSSNKLFTWPSAFLAFIQRKQLPKLIIFTIVFIVLFIWNCFSYSSLFTLLTSFYKIDTNLNNMINEFSELLVCTLYYFYDVDLFLIVFFIMIISWLVKGQSGVIRFLQNDNWNFFSRPYFTFILIICGMINTLLYQADNKVKVNQSYIVFYSLINAMFGFILCAIGYVLFELPLKRFNKFLLIKGKGKEKKHLGNSRYY